MSGQRRVVVSGFEAFGAHARNPTGEAVRAFQRDPSLAQRARFVVLPVTYEGASKVLAAHVEDEQASGCLMFGLAGSRSVVCVETTAYNVMDAPVADNAGVLCEGAVLRSGAPDALTTRAPVDDVVRTLEGAGVAVERSTDPGRFVCNATYYRALLRGIEHALFVHVPPPRELGGEVSDATLRDWMRITLEGYLKALAPR